MWNRLCVQMENLSGSALCKYLALPPQAHAHLPHRMQSITRRRLEIFLVCARSGQLAKKPFHNEDPVRSLAVGSLTIKSLAFKSLAVRRLEVV